LTISHFHTIKQLPNQNIATFSFYVSMSFVLVIYKTTGENIITKSCLIKIEIVGYLLVDHEMNLFKRLIHIIEQ